MIRDERLPMCRLPSHPCVRPSTRPQACARRRWIGTSRTMYAPISNRERQPIVLANRGRGSDGHSFVAGSSQVLPERHSLTRQLHNLIVDRARQGHLVVEIEELGRLEGSAVGAASHTAPLAEIFNDLWSSSFRTSTCSNS